jgi:hypothetical protein
MKYEGKEANVLLISWLALQTIDFFLSVRYELLVLIWAMRV